MAPSHFVRRLFLRLNSFRLSTRLLLIFATTAVVVALPLTVAKIKHPPFIRTAAIPKVPSPAPAIVGGPAISLTTLGSAYTQNFDTLSNTAGSTTNNLTITGWALTESGGGARDNEQYAVDTGSSNTGDTYSYGAASNTDRALGGLRSGTLIPIFGACFTNNTGSTITNLAVAYTGEEWRLGTAARTDQINFEYSTNATDLTTGTWTGVSSLNFVTPDTATIGAKNGNAAGDRTTLSTTISSLSIPNGATFFIRWTDTDASGADDGLAVDDFSLTPLNALTLNCLPTTFGENAGTNVSTCTVTRDGSTTAALTVNLMSGDVSEATVPVSVTIPVNSTNTTFMVDAVDDLLLDGTQSVTITASAINYSSGTVSLMVTDNETAALTLSCLPTTFSENAGANASTCTVTRNTDTTAALTVTLMSNDTSEATVPVSVTIPITLTSTTFMVDAVDDILTDGTQTVTITASAASHANGTAMLMVTNDDFTPIHDIQGPGATSPLSGVVTTRGIVTGVVSNGFFIQEPDAGIDANPATCEGIFVFTSGAPPAAAVIGNLVEVTGTITEFVPSADPLQPPLTELTSPTVTQLSMGNPLPAPIVLTAALPDPAGTHDQLERLEGMRVSVASLTVVGPTQGNVDEANATATSTGVFYGVVTGVARPFREPGIQAPDPAPAGTIPPIPRFDTNPEVICVDSNAQTGTTALDVGTTAVVTNLVGPLTYTFRRYTILPDLASPPMATGGPIATAVNTPASTEFTVAAYNLERFFDTVNDPGISDPVLTMAAFNKRLVKASDGIRNFLKTPDIVGIVEVENLTTLQALATQINNDAVANAQPNPNYVAFLKEGNDVGGIDVGFLVKSALVSGATPRVTVVGGDVVQEGKTTTFANPDASTDLLNDRPPLRLDAVINHPNGTSFPLTVIVVHQRSLSDVGNTAPGSNGWATTGDRVRAKRQAQAIFLANLIQTRQTNNPAERIVVVGDFNAFQFNDGFVDAMNTVQGTPTPDNETVVPGDGADLVNPDLTNLLTTEAALQRYSFVFDGNAQTLDHVLVNQALINATTARHQEHPRLNADFPETARNGTTVERLADHDPVVGFFQVAAFSIASSVSGTKTVSGSFTPGSTITYTVKLTNSSAGTQFDNPGNEFTDVLPAGLLLVAANASSGNAVATVGTNTVTWNGSIPSNSTITITIQAKINNVPTGTMISNQGQLAYDADGNGTNEAAGVTDDPGAVGATNPTVFTVTVIPFRVGISDPLICTGDANTLSVHAEVMNPNNAAGTFLFRASLPAQLSGVANTCVISGGTCTVNNGDVMASGPIAANQTITIDYKVRVAPNVGPGTNLCIDSMATLNGVLMATVQACTVLNCPAANVPVNAQASGQKAGAVLVFPYYISNAAQQKDTRLTISNIGAQQTIAHIFFIDGATCRQSDLFLCLTPNASASFKALEYDPEATGWLLAVAVDANGLPVPNNALIGNAFVQDGQYVDNYNAQSFAANSPALAAINGNTATLFFDGGSYDGVPGQFTAEIQSPVDASGQKIITAGLRGDLTTQQMTGAGQVGSGLAINGNEKPSGSFSAFLAGSCQAIAVISTASPRVPNGLGTMIPSGQAGSLKFNVGAAAGLLLTPRTAAWRGIRALHTTALTTTTITIPVLRPVC